MRHLPWTVFTLAAAFAFSASPASAQFAPDDTPEAQPDTGTPAEPTQYADPGDVVAPAAQPQAPLRDRTIGDIADRVVGPDRRRDLDNAETVVRGLLGLTRRKPASPQ